MKVQNQCYLRKIAKNVLCAKKSRTGISILAIALTCILFTTLFSVSIGLKKSIEYQTMKSIGTTAHGSFKDVSLEDIELLSKDSDIKSFSRRTMIGILMDGKTCAEISYQDKNAMSWSIMNSVKGEFPNKDNEVFVDINTLTSLGYKGEIGEEITLFYEVKELATDQVIERRKDDFILSGTYEIPIDSNIQVGQIFVSGEYCKELKLPIRQNEMGINFSNSWKIEDKLVKVAERNGYVVVDDIVESTEKNHIRIGINYAYLSNGDNFNFLTMFIPVLIMMGIILLVGYLLINNIFEISIIQDIQLYGNLKTIGTTGKQIKKIVNLQGLFLSFPSIIIGNTIGLFLGNTILSKIISGNFMLEKVDFFNNDLIFVLIFSAIFSLITVYVSCLKPAKFAATISAIQATKYQGDYKIKNVKSKKFSLNKLAFRQVFLNKKKYISIVISISLSAIILNSVLTYTGSIDLDKGLSDNIRTDYNIASPEYFRYLYQGSKSTINKDYVETLKTQKGFMAGGGIYSYGMDYTYPNVRILGLKCSAEIFGMDSYLLKKQTYLEGFYDDKKWETGYYTYVGERADTNNESDLKIGDKIEVECNGKKIAVEILGKIRYSFSNGLRYFRLVYEDGSLEGIEGDATLDSKYIYLNTKTYKELTGDSSLMSYGFDIEDDFKKDFDILLKSLDARSDFAFDSREMQLKSFNQFKKMVEFVGFATSFILFLIGILNFINIIASDILKNKVNLSIIEAIGMTKTEVLSYLIRKSLIYSVGGFIISLTLGIILDFTILKDFINSIAWTTYSTNLAPLILVNIFNITIGMLFTKIFYKLQVDESLIERIRKI